MLLLTLIQKAFLGPLRIAQSRLIDATICHEVSRNVDGLYSLRLLAESYQSGQEKESALQKFLCKHKGSSIVYVQTHKVG